MKRHLVLLLAASLACGRMPAPETGGATGGEQVSLRAVLELTEGQAALLAVRNAEFSSLAPEKARLLREAQREFARESRQAPLDPMAVASRARRVKSLLSEIAAAEQHLRSELRAGLSPEQLSRLSVSAEGYQHGAQRAVVRPEKVTRLDFVLAPL